MGRRRIHGEGRKQRQFQRQAYTVEFKMRVIQPADAVWIKPMKDRLRGAWVKFLRDQLKEYNDSNSADKFTMSAPQRATIVEWVVSAWEGLSSYTISAGFKKCHLIGEGDDPASYEIEDTIEMQASIDKVTTQLERLEAFVPVVEDDIVESAVEEDVIESAFV